MDLTPDELALGLKLLSLALGLFSGTHTAAQVNQELADGIAAGNAELKALGAPTVATGGS